MLRAFHASAGHAGRVGVVVFRGAFTGPLGASPMQFGLQRLVNHLVHQRGFPRTRHAGNNRQKPERNRDIHALQVMQPGSEETQHLSFVYVAPMLAPGHVHFAAQILRGERAVFVSHQLSEIALEDDVAAMFARSWSEIDDMVRRAHHVGIMLYNDDGVADVPKFDENAEQALRVAAVQAD